MCCAVKAGSAKAFYDAVLATLQIGVVMEHPGAVAYGRAFPEFWVAAAA